MSNSLFTLEQVTEHLNVSDDTVRRAIAKGDMEAFKIGKLWRISQDQLNAYLTKRTVSFSKRKKMTIK